MQCLEEVAVSKSTACLNMVNQKKFIATVWVEEQQIYLSPSLKVVWVPEADKLASATKSPHPVFISRLVF